MRDKPRIEKANGSWRVRMPIVGFAHPPDQHYYIQGFRRREDAARWLEAYQRYRSRPS